MSKRDRDHLIIEALAHNLGHREAAQTAGVSTKTIQRRLQDPEFRLRLHDRRTQVEVEQGAASAAALHHAAAMAVDVLLDLMDVAGDDRLRANCATDILDRAGLGKPTAASKRSHPLPEEVNQPTVHEKLAEMRHNMRIARTMDIPERWTKVDKAQVSESTPAEPPQPPRGFDPGATSNQAVATTRPGPPPDLRNVPWRNPYLT